MQSKWRSSSSRIIEDRRGHSTEEGGVQSGHTRPGKVRVRRRQRSISSWITEVRRGHSTEEGGVQSGHTRSECGGGRGPSPVGLQRSYVVTVRRGRCPVRSSGQARSDRGHSTEEGGVQPGHRGQTRSSCRGGPAPVRSQRTDEVTVQKREVSSQVKRGQARSECREGRGPSPVGSQRSDEVTVQKREVSSQVTRGQARSECRVSGGPVPVG